MAPYFIALDALAQLWAKLPDGEAFGVIADSDSSDYQRLPAGFAGRLDLASARALSSPRSVLFPMREVVARYPDDPLAPEDGKPIIIIGPRACDLRAVQLLDKILLEGEFRDPFYAARRERTLLISVDCSAAADACFCTSVGGKPYLDESQAFDLHLSPVEGGYVVDVGSEKGKEAVVLAGDLLQEANAEQLAQRDAARARMEETVRKNNEPYQTQATLSDLVRGSEEAELWRKSAAVCSECGACTLVCPTCHCFLLYDQLVADGQAERVRSLDSCLYASYARMAGVGGLKSSPRPALSNRFLNRLLHKFVWQPDATGDLGCVGCGRCIEVDMGGLDLRKFIQELEG